MFLLHCHVINLYMRLFIYIFFLSSIYTIALCQQSEYQNTQINIENGLAHNAIECIYKDEEGIMWFGTHNGLSRYNGTTIITYQNSIINKNSLAGNKVLSICEDTYGVLWIATAGQGVCSFDKQKETFKNFSAYDLTSGLKSNNINNIRLISDTIWVCTGNGLAYYNPSTNNFIPFTIKNEPPNKVETIVYDILRTKDGVYYVTTGDDYMHLFTPSVGSFQPIEYKRVRHLSGNFRKRLLEDKDGMLWISAFSHGLVRFDPTTNNSEIFTTRNSTIPSDLLNGYSLTYKNQIWFATDGSGIIIYDLITESFSIFNSNSSKLDGHWSNIVNSLFIDNLDRIWIGTFNEGVHILDPNQLKFSTLRLRNGEKFDLNGISVLSIFEDSRKTLWVGTDGKGLFQFKNGELNQFLPNSSSNSISSDRIICINEDEYGNILLGTYMGGLSIYRPDKNVFQTFTHDPNNDLSIASDNVWDIYFDSQNRAWIGLLDGGLDLYNHKSNSFIHYGPNSNKSEKINHNNILSIIEDSDNNMWFATEGDGIYRLENKTEQMQHLLHSSGTIKPSSNNIYGLYEDNNGIIWIATENGGLNRYDKKNQHISYLFKEDGLPCNIIYSITADNNDVLWLGTAYGVSSFEKESKTFTNYDIYDGLKGYICNRNALFKRKDGSILIGSTNGLNIFHPESMSKRTTSPETQLTTLRINNRIINVGDTINNRVILKRNINYTEQITIKPKDKIFTLEFVALTYTLPEKCSYMHQLEGFDEDWEYTDASRNNVTYSNLKPGNYVFKVKASNSDKVWSDNISTLSIRVLPSFWQTIYFKLLIGLFSFSIIYSFYRNRLKIKEKHFLREKEAHEQKILLFEKDKLESELNNQTFNILNRNRTLLNYKMRLDILGKRVDEKNKTILKDIISEIDSQVNEEKDWKHIEPRLDKVYNNFMTSLKDKHADLTQNELRIAAYVRMGLSSKEISELMQKTLKGVDSDRYRLRKKLDIPINDSLKNYLLDL